MAKFSLRLKKHRPYRLAVVQFRITNNNFFFSLRRRGKLVLWTSCGLQGFKGPRRSSVLAVEETSKIFAKSIQNRGFKWLDLHIVSLFSSRVKAALKGFSFFEFKFRLVRLIPPISHNGMKFKKKRRV